MRLLTSAVLVWLALAPPQERPAGQGFSFRSNVALINVTATVTDGSGRFVSGLRQGDFEVYEDGVLQTTSYFDAERVPVSLGITIDTSGSMVGDKWTAAQAALDRFLNDLLDSQDEVFLSRFDSRPVLLQPWTADRRAAGRSLRGVISKGGTAMFDAVADAIPLAQQGTRRKKALVVISDGKDTSSRIRQDDVARMIQESEVLVYAIGIDGSGAPGPPLVAANVSASKSAPVPSPFPGRKVTTPPPAPAPARVTPARRSGASSDRVNEEFLRAMTDSSGGRTEIIYAIQDLDQATAGIAGELSQQYFLAYSSSAPRDGRWHTIEVRVKKGGYLVRARRGFIAS